MTSRIGKMPIEIPQGVETEINGQTVSFKGAKGELSHVVPDALTIKLEENTLTVIPKDESKSTSSLHGLTRTLLNNMIIGVTKGYEKKLEIVGTGYRAMQKGTSLELSLGFSHQVTVEPKEGIQFSLDGQNVIIVSGIDKQQVGETAANIRKLRPPEPYKGKGIRYEGEHIIRKEGKAGK